MNDLDIEEMDRVCGGMRLDDAHGIWVQDQRLSGYQAEYGSILGAAEYYADQTRMAVGLSAIYTPPAHYIP